MEQLRVHSMKARKNQWKTTPSEIFELLDKWKCVNIAVNLNYTLMLPAKYLEIIVLKKNLGIAILILVQQSEQFTFVYCSVTAVFKKSLKTCISC